MTIKKWLIAKLTDRYVWRVTYPSGERTRLLSHREAYPLYRIYGGKIYIDYVNGWF